MKRLGRCLALFLALGGTAAIAEAAPDAALLKAIASPQRSDADRARDPYRHPAQTLGFFGLNPKMTVVEIWPGTGWYSDILGPYLRDAGHYYAATPAASLPEASEGARKGVAALQAKFAADPARFGTIAFSEFQPPQRTAICPPGTADRVLSFRNVHNWIAGGFEEAAFESFFTALKPGGVLGVVEHRARPEATIPEMIQSGYVTEEYVKALAENAGFRFVGSSAVNNNPKDTKDYPKGVWTLPPVLTLGDQDRAKYLAIGESDRMTLKFVKPR